MTLSVHGGTFSYPAGPVLLSDLCFSAEPGQVLSILGPNGVGKTTLMRCMLGFLKWQRGETRLDGKPLSAWGERKVWQHIAYVPQARAGVFAYRVEDMVLLGRNPYLSSFQMPGREDLRKAEEAMHLAGIEHLRGQSTLSLSGGELQLVLIARALAAEPRCLILDEPETGLDLCNQLVVLDLIRRLTDREGLTVVLNTHYPHHALRVSDRVLLLFGGGVYQFGRTREMLTEESLRALFGVDIALWRQCVGQKEYAAVIPLERLKGETTKWLRD